MDNLSHFSNEVQNILNYSPISGSDVGSLTGCLLLSSGAKCEKNMQILLNYWSLRIHIKLF